MWCIVAWRRQAVPSSDEAVAAAPSVVARSLEEPAFDWGATFGGEPVERPADGPWMWCEPP